MIVALAFAAISCGSTLERAASNYRRAKDFANLEVVAKSLHKGMPRVDVGRMLGAPDYSPVEGQYYYSSDRQNQGLVVDYRLEGQLTDRLQDFTLGPIGE